MAFTDRSRVDLDWTCRRARYHAYEWEGIGLAPMQKPKELLFGGLIADELAKIKLGQKWSTEAFSGEDKALAEGLLTGYETIVWPRWMQHYDLVSVEQECPIHFSAAGDCSALDNPWLTYNARPDTVVRRKSDKTLWYGPEDKTTGYLDSLLAYAQNVQLHATGACIERHYSGERVVGAMVQGLYKGFEKEGRLYHPLVYAYCKEGRAGIIPDQWSVKWQRAWDRTAVALYPGGVRGWIKKLTGEDLAGIFPNSEPVTIKRPFVEDYFRQVVIREQEIQQWRDDGRDRKSVV